MPKSYKILFVSSEVYPFSKESGISDVAHSLPIFLRNLGHDVRIITPKYGSISERKSKIHNISRLTEIPIKIGKKSHLAIVKSALINSPKFKIQVYFITNHEYFERRMGIYHDPITWKEYPDNSERFIFFSKAVLETCANLNWVPDIIHFNDWQTALIPALILDSHSKIFSNAKTVFTIHNFYRQGIYSLSSMKKIGLSEEILRNYEHNGKFNFMKGALHYANYITTVSPTFRDEMLEDNALSNGLNEILNEKTDIFRGILNGIDKYVWNPRKDKLIHYKLSSDVLEFKNKNKEQLQKIAGLPINPDVPLYGMIPRIGYQKGIGLFLDAVDKIFKNDIQLILLGQGDTDLKSKLVEVAKKYPSKFKPIFIFDDNLSHQIEAGVDFFLMPSKYEPCGLNVMYSINYGAIPIVRATGGMKDSTQNINLDTKDGNSIVFKNYDVKDFTNAILKSIAIYQDKELLTRIMQNGTEYDFSWKKSSQKYDAIYRTLMKE